MLFFVIKSSLVWMNFKEMVSYSSDYNDRMKLRIKVGLLLHSHAIILIVKDSFAADTIISFVLCPNHERK
jgi:hypothetical protein